MNFHFHSAQKVAVLFARQKQQHEQQINNTSMKKHQYTSLKHIPFSFKYMEAHMDKSYKSSTSATHPLKRSNT